VPAPDRADGLILQGAVLLRVLGRRPPEPELVPGDETPENPPLSSELAAALAEPRVRPLAHLWRMLRADGLLTPLALATVLALSVGALMVEALLFRGLFDVARDLALAEQRLLAMGALILFMVLLWAMELPVVSETQRLGRHLDTRLRLALLRKLPRLGDRYLQSRPISDMAERSHSIHLMHGLPGLGVTLIGALWDLLLTLAAIAYIAPQSLGLALVLAACAVLIPLAAQPLVAERDLRVRSHAGALNGFYLDALLGIAPVRTHAAERVVRREHEGLLTQWLHSGRRLVGASLSAEAVQSLICLALAGWTVFAHVERAGVSGDLLLLVYWVLKLPVIGEQLADAALTYPSLRNTALRLLEPLGAPEGPEADPRPAPVPQVPREPRPAGVAIRLQGVQVVAGGHVILDGLDLAIRPGEHLAIVGRSGAGKSTLLGLLLGWHRCAAGTLEVDEMSLAGQGLADLRRETAWVDPGVQLWNRPLLANLRYSAAVGPMAGLGEVLERAELTRVLASLPEGLQTPLGEGGARLSGGEGQRVRLGRALWQAGVRLALLDEPFRGLDRDQRGRLLGEARACWAGATLLCVTHDLAETRAFDRVLVIEDGGLVEDGSPADLAADPGSRYRALLDAETDLKGLWGEDTPWRRLRLRDGRLHETPAGNRDD
jgi:ABC-type bacteriocin/lantibiotic exporter with double-glycine peptidase domain